MYSVGEQNMNALLTTSQVQTMTAIITDCQSTIEARLVDQSTGDTLQTTYHDNMDSAVEFAAQADRIEFDTL